MMAASRGAGVDWESIARGMIDGDISELVVPEGITKLRGYCFANMGFSRCVLANTLNNVSSEAFYNCRQVTDVVIGSGLTNLGNATFDNCVSLPQLTIPSQVTYIGTNFFRGCKSFRVLICEGATPPSIESNTLVGATNLSDIYVPDASVEAYKAAKNWSSLASRIKGISERPTT
jgi:hypothetical protein